MIDTRKVKDRRRLRFESFAEAVRDAESLAEAERAGTLRATGNWTLGQAIGHVAFWANAPFDGYPETRPMPWLMKKMLPLFKNRFLNKGLPAGARIPGVPDGTFGVDAMPTDQALTDLRAAFDRMASQAPTEQNPLFGPMTHADWIKLNLRHAELHFSFFHPRWVSNDGRRVRLHIPIGQATAAMQMSVPAAGSGTLPPLARLPLPEAVPKLLTHTV